METIMSYLYYNIPNLNFIMVYNYKYHYTRSQKTHN
jgi:hypothetical protein